MTPRNLPTFAGLAAILALSGCASLSRPSTEQLAALPTVEFPNPPPAGDFILKLPGGKPIATQVVIEGSALASGASQTLNATLPRDLYVYRDWVSEDGKNWKPAADMLRVEVAVTLPSQQHPKPGEIRVKVDRKDAGN
ncbi:MAG: hypothetical protein M0Q22_07640 [Sulfuritalea sp.]|jgi:hypothetical protein|nr:hypothetical protein [Sulfuritalea sp.]